MLAQKNFELIRKEILSYLDKNLSKDLYYHSVHHTIDVELQAERIALNENITSEEDLYLLRIACLYHDSGFLFAYTDHEDAGCNLAIINLKAFDLTDKQIGIVCGLIQATKIPQTPLTKLEEIICDADLDYLGREDFFEISYSLFLELKAKQIVVSENDWNQVQVKFFKQHHYFTSTSKKLREKQKQVYLEMIEATVLAG